MKTQKLSILLGAFLLTTVGVIAQQQQTLEPNADRLKKDVSHLASDALDGRRTGTAGADEAARYIAGEFSKIGLKAGVARYLQSFPYVAGVELGQKNRLSANDVNVSVTKDWMPLGFSANGSVEKTAAILVGYGITVSELNHNDYANPKVAGRVAIALSGTPDGDNPHGQFARYDEVRWKAIAARNAGAKALIVIAREQNFTEDRLARLRYDNTAGDAGIPVIAISRQAA
ncbi:MAG TPA: PA domain-containing protein, partial [Pyrinomonadaceae bacterium]|nr:PA domain-containing protein [Pyrinomonadaceae bacterium]